MIGGTKMADFISVYTIEEGEKRECNVIAFFRNAESKKRYVIIVSPNDNNTVIPFWVNDYAAEQELHFLEDDKDKNIIARFCENELEERSISFSYPNNIRFYAILDLEIIKFLDRVREMQLQEMLFPRKFFKIDENNGKSNEKNDVDNVKISLNKININEPQSISEFIKNCINVSRYDQWINKEIEEVKNKISKFHNSDVSSSFFKQLNALQDLIELLSKPIKEKRAVVDALVNLFELVNKDELNINAILMNKSMADLYSESERKEMYGEIVFRVNEKFDFETVNTAANYFYEKNDFKKAVKLFVLLTERDGSKTNNNDIVELYNSIGCCYVGLMRFDDSYQAFRKAIEMNSNYAYAYNNWAYALMKECEVIPKDSVRETKLQEALRRINQAIQHNNKDVGFYSNKACIEYDRKSFQDVIEDFEDARKISSNFKDLETMLILKINSKIELYYLKKETLSFSDFIDDLEEIYKKKIGGDKFLYQALEVYYNIKNFVDNADEVCFRILVLEFIVNKLMSALEIQSLDQGIYFYTKLSSLQSFLADDKFRQPIFCADHMNDPNEGQELIRAFLQKIDSKVLIQDLFDKSEDFDANKRRQKLHAKYIFLKAFTENDDSLPMWIHYGDEGKGCCVKINPRFFGDFKSDFDTEEKNLGIKSFDDEYKLYRVLYLKNGKLSPDIDAEIRQLYNDFIEIFNELCSQYEEYSRQLKDAVKDPILKIISKIMYLFKNSDYQYEKEMRIVLQRSLSDLEREDIDIQTTSPTESNPIPKVFIYTKKPLEIEEIILGPKLSETNNIIPYVTMRLLKMNKYRNEPVNITKSSIKYR